MGFYRNSFKKRLVKLAISKGYSEQKAKKLVEKYDEKTTKEFDKWLKEFSKTIPDPA